jgi:uncharacterized UPF0160 family protein
MQKVITHNGCFHTDEVVACMLLDIFFNGIDIIRTRDEELMKDDSYIVVDVGRVYNGINRFDHHQYPDETGHVETWERGNNNIPLSSAGMIWKHFGIKLMKKLFKESLSEEDMNKIYNKMYNNFFLEIDANDNGIDQYPPEFNVRKKFGINTTLIGTIGRINGTNVYNDEIQHDLFIEAMDYAEKMFLIHLHSYYRNQKCLTEERRYMVKYYNKRLENGHIIVIEHDISNWRTLLRELDVSEEILYLIYPREDQWGVKTIPKSGFVARKDLAVESILREAVGKDLIFAHKKKFMCSCRTKEAAIKCAIASLK